MIAYSGTTPKIEIADIETGSRLGLITHNADSVGSLLFHPTFPLLTYSLKAINGSTEILLIDLAVAIDLNLTSETLHSAIATLPHLSSSGARPNTARVRPSSAVAEMRPASGTVPSKNNALTSPPVNTPAPSRYPNNFVTHSMTNSSNIRPQQSLLGRPPSHTYAAPLLPMTHGNRR
jgi:hypothetical protein